MSNALSPAGTTSERVLTVYCRLSSCSSLSGNYDAIENRFTIHDLHATLLHLLGLDHTRLDHTRLTWPYSGRDLRLTDVYGEVATGILA